MGLIVIFLLPLACVCRPDSEIISEILDATGVQLLDTSIISKTIHFPESVLCDISQSQSSDPAITWYFEHLNLHNQNDESIPHLKLKHPYTELVFRHKIANDRSLMQYAGLYYCIVDGGGSKFVGAGHEVTIDLLVENEETVHVSQTHLDCQPDPLALDARLELSCGEIESSSNIISSSVFTPAGEEIPLQESLDLLVSNISEADTGVYTYHVLGSYNSFYRRVSVDLYDENAVVTTDSLPSKSLDLMTTELFIAGTSVLFILLLVVCFLSCYFIRMKLKKQEDFWRTFFNAPDKLTKKRKLRNLLVIFPKEIAEKTLIGEGAFGSVYKANLERPGCQMKVAVKNLKEGFVTTSALTHELAILQKLGENKNILKLIGFCPHHNKLVAIVTEFCEKGSLLSFLKSRPLGHISHSMFYDMIGQTLNGMSHLESNQFVHRDLAARNIFITSDFVLKIGDFGLGKDIQYVDYYQMTSGGLLPYKWMAPECLTEGRFTSKSDVWSFGVLLWEIFTHGDDPYHGFSADEYCSKILAGYRLMKPKLCPGIIYKEMRCCWSEEPSDRFSFTKIKERFKKFADFYDSFPAMSECESNYYINNETPNAVPPPPPPVLQSFTNKGYSALKNKEGADPAGYCNMLHSPEDAKPAAAAAGITKNPHYTAAGYPRAYSNLFHPIKPVLPLVSMGINEDTGEYQQYVNFTRSCRGNHRTSEHDEVASTHHRSPSKKVSFSDYSCSSGGQSRSYSASSYESTLFVEHDNEPLLAHWEIRL